MCFGIFATKLRSIEEISENLIQWKIYFKITGMVIVPSQEK